MSTPPSQPNSCQYSYNDHHHQQQQQEQGEHLDSDSSNIGSYSDDSIVSCDSDLNEDSTSLDSEDNMSKDLDEDRDSHDLDEDEDDDEEEQKDDRVQNNSIKIQYHRRNHHNYAHHHNRHHYHHRKQIKRYQNQQSHPQQHRLQENQWRLGKEQQELLKINQLIEMMARCIHSLSTSSTTITNDCNTGPSNVITMDCLTKVLTVDLQWILSLSIIIPPSLSLTFSALCIPPDLLSLLYPSNQAISKISSISTLDSHHSITLTTICDGDEDDDVKEMSRTISILDRFYQTLVQFLTHSSTCTLLKLFHNPCMTPLLLAIQHSNYFVVSILLQQRFNDDVEMFTKRIIPSITTTAIKMMKQQDTPENDNPPSCYNTNHNRLINDYYQHHDRVQYGFEDEMGHSLHENSTTVIISIIINDVTMLKLLCHDVISRLHHFREE